MFSRMALFLVILQQTTNSNLLVKKQLEFDLSIPLKIKSQFSEMFTMVFCFDNGTKSFQWTNQLYNNTILNMVHYDKNNHVTTPKNNAYFYVIFFHDILSLEHFVDHINYRVHILLILSLNITEDVVKVSNKLCPILNLFIFDMTTSKLLVCKQGYAEDNTMVNVKIETTNFPELRHISDFQGRKFKVGTTFFPSRLEYK